jgi:exopolysaccharide biosynthesis protein
VRVGGLTKRAALDSDPWIVNAAMTIHDGVVDIIEIKDNYAAAGLKDIDNIGVGGPMLVYNGKICEEMASFKSNVLPVWQKHANWENGAFLYSTHPRTAFGISKDQKTVYHVTVDGRFSKAVGMQTKVLAKLMRGLGCYKALNFDGGGGTAMYIYGYGLYQPAILTGIVNHPCDPQDDGKRYWDNPKLRPCGCAVYIKSDLK